MTTVTSESLVVAKRPGTRLFLAGGSRMQPSFEGLSERTIFFREGTADRELRALRVPPDSIEWRPAKLSLAIG